MNQTWYSVISVFMLLLVLGGCEHDHIVNITKNDVTYLPNIHWYIVNENESFEVDTVYVPPEKKMVMAVKIYYDNPENFRKITLEIDFEAFGENWNSYGYRHLDDNTLDSSKDTLIYSVNFTVGETQLVRLQAEIWENESFYDLKRYKNLYIFN